MRSENKEAESIRRLFAEMSRAVAGADWHAFAEGFERDSMQFSPKMPILSGLSEIGTVDEPIISHYQNELRIEVTDVVVHLPWGFCSGTFSLRTLHRTGGRRRFVHAKFLAVVRKSASGAWRIYRVCHNSTLPDA